MIRFSVLLLGFVISVLVIHSCSRVQKVSSKNTQPNVVFILADDLGYSDLSCMGSQYYETPNIDAIARNGVIYQWIAACQVCSPSRASILTGKIPARHGITDWIGAKSGEAWRANKRYNQLLPADYVHELSKEDITLAEAFANNAYKTFFAGKWHLGNEGSYPTDHGFEINQGGYERGGPYSGGFFSPFNNPQMKDHPDEVGMSLSMKLAKETAQFIASNKDAPFLAYLSFYAVHAPIQTTEDKWGKYRVKAIEQGVSDEGFKMERRLPIRKNQDNPIYAGLIEQMDEGVGYVLKTLKELGLEENTIVIFTSDNGGVASGDNFSTSNAPLRGGKGYQWEGGIRVPFIVNVPWLTSSTSKCEQPVMGTDFYPSLLELCGLEALPDQHKDGVSFVPLLTDKQMAKRSLFWHYPHYGNQGGDPSAVLRKGRWKLIHYFEDGRDELYHIAEDIGEANNVIAQYPEVAKGLKIELQDKLDELGARRPIIDPLYNADSAQIKQEYYSQDLIKRLERQRKDFLDPDWSPNENWWGSQLTID